MARVERAAVRLEIGPLPSAGGQAWLDQCRVLVSGLRAHGAGLFVVPPEVLEEFDRYFDDWEQAVATDPFVWSREVDRGALRTLMTYWLNLAQALVDHPEQLAGMAPEGVEFYRRLVSAILEAMVADDPSARTLQERWPQL